jgi:phage antirepressor YoqD-like protein
MTSLEISELTGKRHSDVLRDITVIQDQLSGERKFAVMSGYMDKSNRKQPMWIMDKSEVMTLLSGYSVTLRVKVIDRWLELEAKQAPALPQTFSEALQLAADQAKLLEEQKPKVEFVDRYVESTGNKGFREVCKLLGIKEPVFREFLTSNKIMYQLGTSWTAYQNHIDAGRFHVTTGESNSHAFTTTKFTPKGVQWVSALWNAR